MSNFIHKLFLIIIITFAIGCAKINFVKYYSDLDNMLVQDDLDNALNTIESTELNVMEIKMLY
jgi:hypothetical protein